MATQAQIDANRRNSQKSTGPRTPEGKAAVSRNALKHGFRSRDVVLPAEDPDGEFPLLLEELTDEWQPDTLTGRTLVEDLAGVLWRQQRAARIEQGTLISAGEVATDKIWGRPTPPDPDQHHEIGTRILAEAYAIAADSLDRIHRHQDRLSRSQARLLRQLETRFAKAERSNPIDAARMRIDTFSLQSPGPDPEAKREKAVCPRFSPVSPSLDLNLAKIERSNPISTEFVPDLSSEPLPFNSDVTNTERSNPIHTAKMGIDTFSLQSPGPDPESDREKAVCPEFSPASPSHPNPRR